MMKVLSVVVAALFALAGTAEDAVNTLTLDPKGGTVASTTVDLPAASLPIPVRDGYHFVGWFKDDVARLKAKLYPTSGNINLYPVGKYLFGTPLTSAAVTDADTTLYAKWVKNDVYNHFSGKKAVFVGDSVTTLAGYAVRNEYPYNAIHYTEAISENYELNENTTWWGQLVQALDMTRLSVNAVSGSPLVDASAIAAGPRAMSCVKRIDDLDVNGTPDVIFIFGGINDFAGAGNTQIDDFDPAAAYLDGALDTTSNYFDSFAKGYATMIRRIRNYYPQTEIVAILPYVAVAAQTDVYTKGCATIVDLCDYFHVACVDLRSSGLPQNWSEGVPLLQDGIHPNSIGFAAFANHVLENYSPACSHEHKTALTGVVAATCTTAGYSGDCACEDCEKVLSGRVIPAPGHDWNDWLVTKEPSKTETGLRERNCRRDGCNAHEEEVIPMIADVVALRNVAVVTAVGIAPTLPAKVAGLAADGTVGGEYDVDWETPFAPSAAGITTVNGTAQVNGTPMSVTASVRASSVASVNISPSAASTTPPESVNGSMGRVWTDWFTALTNDDIPTADQFDDFIVWTYGADAKVRIWAEWNSPAVVSKVVLYFIYSGNYQRPGDDLRIYSVDGVTETPIEYDAGDVIDAQTGKDDWYREYVFKSPRSLSKIKIEAPTHNIGRLLFVRRCWVFGVGSVEPMSTDTLTALEVDGSAVDGFEAATTSYSIEDGQAITKAENGTDNVAVTILQKSVTDTDNAYAVTLAEDGESMKKYTVFMPKSHDHVLGPWQVITPATVYAPGLRRRACTYAGCTVKEEAVIPKIERKTVKWIDVDFANYADGSTIADKQVDPADRGTWAKPSADDAATVMHGNPALASLVVTNQYLCYAAKAQTSAGRDATVEVKVKFQKPNADTLPPTLDLGQTAVFVFPKGRSSCYKVYTADGWIELVGATPDFTKFVNIAVEFRYEYDERKAMVKIDDVVCNPVDAETPWFALAGSAAKLSSVDFFGEFDLGPFWGEYLALAVKSGILIVVK